YWPQDALNSYWDDLKGEKHVLYVPNAGHGLQEVVNGKPELIPMRAISTLAAFARSEVFDKPLPKMEWKHSNDANGNPTLTVSADSNPMGGRFWSASAETRDFRKAKWEVDTGIPAGKDAVLLTKLPESGFKAIFAELDFESDGQKYTM